MQIGARPLWSDAEEDEYIYFNEAAAPVAETLTSSISRSSFRSTRIVVREMANMEHKIVMCHSLDNVLRLRGADLFEVRHPREPSATDVPGS